MLTERDVLRIRYGLAHARLCAACDLPMQFLGTDLSSAWADAFAWPEERPGDFAP